ncbi:hypothetical protein PsalN5692_03608 (plasmid) [Piscirickettsia salmonis]|nr:hypothetical protein PsalN5692_03608 [Piscirickettsia salmonis]
MILSVGIDVSKSKLDVFHGGDIFTCKNEKEEIIKWRPPSSEVQHYSILSRHQIL